MPSQTPFVLVDNTCDRINLYPTGVLGYSGAALVGREVQYVADYRRERTFFQGSAAIASWYLTINVGPGVTAAPDTVWIDRGHNLWGRTIGFEGGDDPLTAWFNPSVFSRVVPAQGTVGGDPLTGWCVTEEGAIYTISANIAARANWRIIDNTGTAFQPIIPGLIVGKRIQLLGYSSVLDEDAGERFERTEQSLIPGYAGNDRTYSARKLELRLSLIGAAEYDSSIRTLRRLLFDVNQPFVCCTNYGTKPERTWLYKYQGGQWSSPTSRTYRSATITAYEYGPLIR
jgi:hypothetical protein